MLVVRAIEVAWSVETPFPAPLTMVRPSVHESALFKAAQMSETPVLLKVDVSFEATAAVQLA
jgi:hypothetical protein